MTPDEDTLKVIEEILLGRHNGHLPDIIGACKLVESGNRVQWRFVVDGFPEVSTQNVTLFELERLERLSGVPWETFVRSPLGSMRLIACLLTAVLCEREGCDEPAARDRLKSVTADVLVNGFSFYEVDGVPLVQPEQGNETSI